MHTHTRTTTQNCQQTADETLQIEKPSAAENLMISASRISKSLLFLKILIC